MFSCKLKSISTGLSKTVRPFSNTKSIQQEFNFLERSNGNKIAYRQILSDNINAPGVVYVPGFQSNMHGIKAIALERYCVTNNLPYVRFDYQGCGESTGDLRELTISDWRSDLMVVLDHLTAGPQILVGSSMGGLIMLHAAMARPTRMHALVGVSAAADMPQRRFSNNYPTLEQEVAEKGEVILKTDRHEYVITHKMFEDLSKHSIMTRDAIPITCPVRLLHGMKDETVPFQISLDLAQKLQSRFVNVHFRKSGAHRFSQPEDIELLFEMLDCLVHGSDKAKLLARKSFEAFSPYMHPEASSRKIETLERIKKRDR